MRKLNLEEVEGIIREQPALAPWFKDLLLSVVNELRLERKARDAYQQALTDNYGGLRKENDHLRKALNDIIEMSEE